MKRAIVVLVGLALLPTVSALRPAAQADWPEPTPAVEWIYFDVIQTPTPTPPPPLPVEIREYNHNSADVETLARLLWSSPLRDEDAKETLLWVVLNRVDDQSGKFGDSISTVVTKTEFSFFDKRAHLSDENLSIARDVLNAWKSRKDGCYIGKHVPANGLYIRFIGESNREIEITAEPGGEALVW